MMIDNRVRKVLLPILPAAMDISRRYGLPADYRAGHRPRHFAGNLGNPVAVRVILLLAEPGSSPGPEELNRDEANWLEDVTCDGIGNGGFRLRYDRLARSAYEINPRTFIEMIFPDDSYAGRMKKVVITNSFCMQAHASGRNIPALAAKEFSAHLRRFVSVFPNAIVVAAGQKAIQRSNWAAIPAVHMGALTPPGSNRHDVSGTWRPAAENVRRKLGLNFVCDAKI